MQKLVLLSILVMTVAVPVLAAREPSARLGLRKCVWWMLAAVAVYTVGLLLVYPLVR